MVIFGWTLGGFIVAMLAVIVGLLAGGPVGRFKVSGETAAARSGSRCRDPAMILRLLNWQGIAGLAGLDRAGSACSPPRPSTPATGTRSSDRFEQL